MNEMNQTNQMNETNLLPHRLLSLIRRGQERSPEGERAG
jgi:hypothetical protein